MTASNKSSALRQGYTAVDEDIDKDAEIAASKMGTRTLTRVIPLTAFAMTGTSVAIGEDGIFPIITLPDANSGQMTASVGLWKEWESATDIEVAILWKTTATSGSARFSVDVAASPINEPVTSDDTQVVTDSAKTTAGIVNEATVVFDDALFAAGDLVNLSITRDPTHADDTLGADVKIVGIIVRITGRG